MRAAVFLDRDDTLIACRELPAPAAPAAPGDLVDPALVRLLPGVREGCAALRRAEYVLVVVSNQGVVARGGATCALVERVNARVAELLVDDEGRGLVERFYYCPWHPKGNVPEYTREHPWRKPAPGMILAGAEELGIDIGRSWLIGDAERDVEAGVAAGLRADRCLRIGPGALAGFREAAGMVLLGGGRV